MSTFGTFLLVVTAFIGTLMLITDPTQKVTKWVRGKKKSELEAEAKSWVDEHDVTDVIGKGCGFIFFILLALLYTFVVEPLAVLYALVNKIGYQPVAYIILANVAFLWLQFASRVFTNEKSSQPMEGVVVQTDEEIKVWSPARTFVQQMLYSLPVLYLWYLLLVGTGVL